jgi:serine/threonine protein kinase
MSKLLSQGGYGCVYRPEIKCSGEIGSKNLVSKLQKLNYASKNEYHISNIIRSIKHHKQYFLPALKSCPVKLSNIDENILKPCEIINQKYSYVLMNFKYLENIEFLPFFSTTTKPNLYLIEMYETLVKGLELLYNNNIVHHDLKIENILISTKNNMPIIIDYGISIDMSQANKTNYDNIFYIFAPEYYPWCIELHIISYIVQTRMNEDNDTPLTQRELYDIIDSYTKNSFFISFSQVFVQNYNTALKHHLMSYVNERLDTIMHTLLNNYASWDLVSLSIIFIKLIKIVYETKPMPKIIIDLLEILLLNMSPDITKRPLHTKTLNAIKNLKKMK